jgi:hypothetical protein
LFLVSVLPSTLARHILVALLLLTTAALLLLLFLLLTPALLLIHVRLVLALVRLLHLLSHMHDLLKSGSTIAAWKKNALQHCSVPALRRPAFALFPPHAPFD